MPDPARPSATPLPDASDANLADRLTGASPYSRLARWDRPVGWQLLMWPCWWSLLLAANAGGAVQWGQLAGFLALFLVGAVAMRGAGCTWNDIVDRDLDAAVERTRHRPLASGAVSLRGALLFLAAQLLIGLAVLLAFNAFTIALAFGSIGLVVAYPFAKRVTNWPQIVLGLAFSWGGLLGWTAWTGGLAWPPVFVYLAAVLWTVGYDTIYAHQDREDDALAGIGSTALRFGVETKPWVGAFYAGAALCLALAFLTAGAPLLWAWAALAVFAGHLARQVTRLDIDDPDGCLALFKSNAAAGGALAIGLVLDLL